MLRTILTLAFGAATGVAGYIGGSAWPAPPEWIETINAEADELRARLKLEQVDFAGLREMMSGEKFNAFADQFEVMAAAAGDIIVVEQDVGTLDEQLDNLALSEEEAMAYGPTPISASSPAAAPSSPSTTPNPSAPPATPPAATGNPFEASLAMCPRMTVQNAPQADAAGVISPFAPVVMVEGVRLAAGPVRGACLSSGYGPRNSRLHKGVDYHSDVGGPVLAGGDGVVIEMVYRNDYGNMLLIDHGGGVYTRYAHLASFGPGLAQGVAVKAGEQIGLMGNTGAYAIPVHLHYEVLTGDYNTPKKSFGLTSVDPFAMPSAT